GTEMPYAFFSSHKNTYNSAGADFPVSLMPLGACFEPSSSPVRYVYPTRFQIISAGPDGAFGPGGAWSSATATNYAAFPPGYVLGLPAPPDPSQKKPAGGDDQANFYDARLGAPK